MDIHYRPIHPSEHHFLTTMLYEALFVPTGQPKFPHSILEAPEIKKYVAQWGTKVDDLAIVGVKDTALIGAIWGRKFSESNKGYGFVAEHIPEISLAVKEGYRNQGVGTALLNAMERQYSTMGVKGISLSVDKLNPAIKLYERCGYQYFATQETAITMIKYL